MAGINVNGIGRNPYADSYLTSAKNRSNTTSKDTFVNAVKKVEESKNSADTSNEMYPGDVTIDYPPRINNAVNNSVVSEKSKDEMSLDEYKQWVMNQISQFPVSGGVRSTFSSGAIVIKEEAFEKNIADKGAVVEKILRLDEGFNSVFNRIKEELQTNKKKYAKDIERLKTLVASVTELGVRIQAQELRNKQLVEKRFAQMRKELSQAKRTTSTANAYYKSVNNLNQYESHFLDQKK